MEDLGCQFRRPPFGARGDPSVLVPAILEPERFIRQQPCGTQLDRRFSQGKRDALETGEAAAEGQTLGDVFTGLLDALLGGADAHKTDQGAAEVEPLHYLDKAGTFEADARRRRHADGVEEQLAAADRTRAKVTKAV